MDVTVPAVHTEMERRQTGTTMKSTAPSLSAKALIGFAARWRSHECTRASLTQGLGGGVQ